MLILTRRTGELIRIGEGIQVVVLNINYSQVKLGIDAPREVSIYREEIYRQKQMSGQLVQVFEEQNV